MNKGGGEREGGERGERGGRGRGDREGERGDIRRRKGVDNDEVHTMTDVTRQDDDANPLQFLQKNLIIYISISISIYI